MPTALMPQGRILGVQDLLQQPAAQMDATEKYLGIIQDIISHEAVQQLMLGVGFTLQRKLGTEPAQLLSQLQRSKKSYTAPG